MNHMTDKEIVAAFWQREESALRAVQEKYGRYCERVAFNLLGDKEDAEECVSDTLLTAWNKIPPARPKLLKFFLAKIARQHAFNRYRHRHGKKRGGDALTQSLEELSECLPGQSGTDEIIQEQELRLSINSFLATLPQRDRDVFVRRYFYVEDTKTIAARYNIKKANVLLILSRTRKLLAQHLIREGMIDDNRKII